jgi:hyperosmotically inducible protein
MDVYAIGTAGDINQSPYEAAFKTLDKNGDSVLEKAEATREELFAKHFTEADADHNGTLNEQEYGNYKSAKEQKEVKRFAGDSLITTKIKAALLKDEGLAGLKVSVETHDGVVLLSGFVNTAEQIAGAINIAAAIEGVKSVKNILVLSKEKG